MRRSYWIPLILSIIVGLWSGDKLVLSLLREDRTTPDWLRFAYFVVNGLSFLSSVYFAILQVEIMFPKLKSKSK